MGEKKLSKGMVAKFERQASGTREGFSRTTTAAGRQREQNLDDKTAIANCKVQCALQ